MSNPKLEIDEELAPEDAPGYVVTAKKTLEEYAKLDAEDESLKKWKESLGISTSNTIGDPNDKRKVVILELAVLIEGRDPIVFDLEDAAALETLKRKPIILKEKCVYRLKIKFRIQHEIVTGLKYLQSVKKAGIRVDKTEENCGSFAPNTTDKPFYERECKQLYLLSLP